jgi:Co/Zn/Cd efflux system component
MGLAGGIAFLLILFGGFQIMVSAGNPEQMNAGKEMVTSAIAGLLLIIFSVFLLRLIGYNILRIPGFL